MKLKTLFTTLFLASSLYVGAQTPISSLPVATTANSSDVTVLVQGGQTKQVSITNLVFSITPTINGATSNLIQALITAGANITITTNVSKQLNISVSGLGTAAYSNSSAFAPANQVVTNLFGQKDWNSPYSFRENQAWSGVHIERFMTASNIVEYWNNLNQWNATNVVVTNNTLVSLNAGNPASCVIPFVLGTNDEARISFSINVTTNAGNGYVLFGVSTDAPGVIQAAGGTSGVGIGTFNGTTALIFNKGGTATHGTLIAGVYTGLIYIDTNNVSLYLQWPDHSDQFLVSTPRSTVGNINNLWIFNGDSGLTLGTGIGAISAKMATETATQRKGVELSDTFIQSVDNIGDNVAFWCPSNYDSRVPTPMLVYCHGYGASYLDMYNSALEKAFHQQFVTNGWIVASGDFGGASNWGNSNSMVYVDSFMKYAKRHYNIGSIWFQGTSMGGLTALNYMARHVGEADGFIGISPVCNLLNQYTNVSYTSAINTAYGITGIGTNTYANNTFGFDPIRNDANAYWRQPMQFYYDTGDSLVNQYSNSIQFSGFLQGYSKENDAIYCPGGGHAGALTYQSSNVLSFLGTNSYMPTTDVPGSLSQYFTDLQVTRTNRSANFAGSGLNVTNVLNTSIIALTNSQSTIIDLNKSLVNVTTNATFAWVGFINKSNTVYQTTVVHLKNTSGGTINFTVPLNCYTNAIAVANCTNNTRITFEYDPNANWTNAIITPIN